MTQQNHPYHLVYYSPWPIMTGFSTMGMLTGTIYLLISTKLTLLMLSMLSLMMSCAQWWRDVSRESSFLGFHTNFVMFGLRWGMILFIISEILFFFSFFWAFFHSSLSPNWEMGIIWPPLGTQAINPYQIPLLNTIILLSSGITVTYSHHAIIKTKNLLMYNTMMMTLFLGFYFSFLQGWEYFEASYNMTDSVFGSSFFLATGFHGLHVIIGTFFLLFSLARHKMNLFSKTHHMGLEAAIWYWHFVDVIWLFLFSFLYWWSY